MPNVRLNTAQPPLQFKQKMRNSSAWHGRIFLYIVQGVCSCPALKHFIITSFKITCYLSHNQLCFFALPCALPIFLMNSPAFLLENSITFIRNEDLAVFSGFVWEYFFVQYTSFIYAHFYTHLALMISCSLKYAIPLFITKACPNCPLTPFICFS